MMSYGIWIGAMQCLIKDKKILKLRRSMKGYFQILTLGETCKETNQAGGKSPQETKKQVKHVTFSPDTKFNDSSEENNSTPNGIGKRTRPEINVKAPPRRSKRLRRKMSMVQEPIIQDGHA
mmetsp:Transcript_30751/g.43044  ORF Transcript_30751/g.43044 Transcript_30751/m.43044 type:complete len:121 (-) Transcript_30751:122-484(-)